MRLRLSILFASLLIPAVMPAQDFSDSINPVVPFRVLYREPGGCRLNEIYYNATMGKLRVCSSLNTWSYFSKISVGASTDVTSTFSGTCDATTYLRGDGTCNIPSGTGAGDFSSNTSLSVDSEIVLFSGTAGKTGKRATGSGIAKLTSGVLGTALSSDVISLFTGCSGTQYLGADGACHSAGAGAGDVSSNTSSSVDSEIALFSGTAGKTIKRASGTGLAKLTSGVLGLATSGTDYAPATSGSSPLKGNGAGGFSASVAADIVGLFSTCSGTQYLGADGACHNSAGSGTVTVVGAGNLTSTALVTGGGSQSLQTPATGATLDSSGNLTANSFIGTGSGPSYLQLPQTAAPSIGANAVQIASPASVTTGYQFILPGASGSGLLLDTASANVDTLSRVAVASANTNSAVVQRDGSGNFSAGTVTAALTGNASTATALATTRAVYGNNFDGTAALTQIIGSAFGGTGNGFSKFSGPATSEKTFTLPNASAAILTDNAAVTVAQGGTGQTSYADGQLLIGNTATGLLSKATLAAGANVTITNGNGTITIAASGSGGTGCTTSGVNHQVLIDNGAGGCSSDSTFTATAGVLAAGSDNSAAGTLQLANAGANAHTIWGSGATTSNTILGFATVPATGHLIDVSVSSTTATFHDSGVVTANVVNASSPGAGIAHFAGSTQTVTSSSVVNADIAASTIDLTAKVTGLLPTGNMAVAPLTRTIGCSFDGGGSTITTNSICYSRVPVGATIIGWAIEAVGSSPAITIDVLKIASGTTLPTASITASATPALTSTDNAAKSTAVSTWCSSTPTSCFSANDILGFKVTAPGTATWASIDVYYTVN